MRLSAPVATATVRSKVVVLFSLIRCCCFNCVAAGVVSWFCCVVVLCRFLSSDHLVHIRRWLLDFGCTIVVVNIIFMLLCHDLTTAEPRVKVWRI